MHSTTMRNRLLVNSRVSAVPRKGTWNQKIARTRQNTASTTRSWRSTRSRFHCSTRSLSEFIESELEVPKHLARNVHDHYFNPQYDEFKARTIWSLSNAFTSAFKELD